MVNYCTHVGCRTTAPCRFAPEPSGEARPMSPAERHAWNTALYLKTTTRSGAYASLQREANVADLLSHRCERRGDHVGASDWSRVAEILGDVAAEGCWQ